MALIGEETGNMSMIYRVILAHANLIFDLLVLIGIDLTLDRHFSRLYYCSTRLSGL
jgi:hypothetical protein